MANFQWYDYLRILTITMAFASLLISGWRASKLWNLYTDRLKQLWWVLNTLFLLLIEGSIEQIVTDAGWGPRTLLSFIVSFAALRAMAKDEGYIKS